jgi:hypothetical protein
MQHQDLSSMCDRTLIAEVARLASRERQATAQLIAALAELDARRLYLAEGCSSLFTYCTRVLHLSEHAAYSRIEAARAGRRFPLILELLAKGDINVTGVGLLGRLLTEANHRELLERATHKSKREIEELVAMVRPQPDVPASLRKVPVKDNGNAGALHAGNFVMPGEYDPGSSRMSQLNVGFDRALSNPARTPPMDATITPKTIVAPVAPERYRIQFMVGRETHLKLRRVQDLMRHTLPDGDLVAIFDRALSALLAELERVKFAATSRPRSGEQPAESTRHMPAAVRRAVWKRDGGQCAFEGRRGRCTETGFLEFHHVLPFAAGGKSDESNIQLRCRAHNQYEADLFFGGPPVLREERPVFSSGI